jgi:dUTP pyrophosphatase
VKNSVNILRLPNGEGLPIPRHQTPGSAGMDLSAAIEKFLVIEPGKRALIPTGFSIALPIGTEAQIRPRSGLALKNGITVLNAPGTIDSDYRGEVSVLLINHGEKLFTISRGDRIAQMVIAEVLRVKLVEVAELSKSSRNTGGYGSTGNKVLEQNGAFDNGTD